MLRPAVKQTSKLVLLFALLSAFMVGHAPSSAAPQAAVWSAVNLPAEGTGGKWQLAAGSDVKLLSAAVDGTLFAYANPPGTNNTLFKSVDNGISWTACPQVTDIITALKTAPDDKSRIYYATNSTVWISSDGGITFTEVESSPGGAGNGNITITSMAVVSSGSSRLIAVGTRDSDSGEFGGVFTLNESDQTSGWTDTGLENCNVASIAFSPNYAADGNLIAVGSTQNGTAVSFRTGNNSWGMISGNASIPGIIPVNAVISLPADFVKTFFVGIDSGNGSGDVFRINMTASPNASIVSDLNIAQADNLSSIDVSGLSISGINGGYFLAAGSTNGTRIYLSGDSGQNWTWSLKEPTGENITGLLIATDFAASRRIYAGTSGTGSAFSYTVDAGQTWNQLSLIDTSISALLDLAVSPRYYVDNTLFLLTWGGEHSLWRSRNSGTNWERIYTGGPDSFSYLELSPQYGADGSVVVLAGTSGEGAIWNSDDDGQTFVRRIAGFPIDVLAVASNDDYFIGSYNGSAGMVYRTVDGGVSYSPASIAGFQPLKTIALSPNFQQDMTVLAGNSNGWVYLSTDTGASFDSLPAGANSSTFSGNMYVAFDRQYSSSRLIYTASDNPSTASSKSRLHRYTVGESQQWENLDFMLDVGGMLGQLCVLPGGSLYAANSHDNGGMERSINPGAASYPFFEKVNAGLSDKAALNGLWGSGNQLWSLDTRNNMLVTYVDTLSAPVVLMKPEAGASAVDTRNAALEWQWIESAMTYEWQVDYDGSFTAIPSSLKGTTPYTSVRLPRLDPVSTYYWRVRVKEPTLSPWSSVQSFYSALGAAGTLPELYSPRPGASGIALKPVFSWYAIGGADRYELLIAKNSAFTDPVVDKTGNNALSVNAWQCDFDLSYNTTYFWKARGTSSNSFSPWSGVGVFTTLMPPLPPPPPPALASLQVELIGPPAGAQGIGIIPVFEWKALAGAGNYELLVSRNISFNEADIVKVGIDALPATIWLSDRNLSYQTTYYWKVRGVNGVNASAWSDTNSFTTISAVPDPLASANVVLEYPVTGAEGVSVKPIFRWKPVAGAEGYDLVISIDNAFADPVIEKTGQNELKGTVWQSDIDLEYRTAYYWRVRAVSGGTWSSWSEAAAFVTLEPPPQKVTVIELESPKAGADGVSITPIFQWKSVEGAGSYELLVSKSPALNTPVIDKTGRYGLAANVWRSDIELDKATTYYWRVRAVTDGNSSPWSDVSAFITELPVTQTTQQLAAMPPDRSVLIFPEGGAVGINTRPLFEWHPVTGAEKYELVVAADVGFTKPKILRTGDYSLPSASWQSDIELAGDNLFYWKVRAIGADTPGDWSIPGVFITASKMPPMLPAGHPGLPAWALNTGYALVGAIGLLIVVILALVTRTGRG